LAHVHGFLPEWKKKGGEIRTALSDSFNAL